MYWTAVIVIELVHVPRNFLYGICRSNLNLRFDVTVVTGAQAFVQLHARLCTWNWNCRRAATARLPPLDRSTRNPNVWLHLLRLKHLIRNFRGSRDRSLHQPARIDFTCALHLPYPFDPSRLPFPCPFVPPCFSCLLSQLRDEDTIGLHLLLSSRVFPSRFALLTTLQATCLAFNSTPLRCTLRRGIQDSRTCNEILTSIEIF